jgi:hypothetical protein
MPELHPLGRRVPPDWKHVEKYAYRSIAPRAVDRVERCLSLPEYRAKYDQQREGACVGFASSWMMSILNRRYYDARWLWNEAKTVDQWPSTNPGDNNGTSVRAAMDVLRAKGHVRLVRNHPDGPLVGDGIQTNRWATTVDEIRTAIAGGTPVTLGINWYTNFDTPERKGLNWWIGANPKSIGRIRGGHAVCIYRASDRLQAVGIVNNWGPKVPLVLMPYATLDRLLDEDGEATLVTDR